jgi:hypothetical protein
MRRSGLWVTTLEARFDTLVLLMPSQSGNPVAYPSSLTLTARALEVGTVDRPAMKCIAIPG